MSSAKHSKSSYVFPDFSLSSLPTRTISYDTNMRFAHVLVLVKRLLDPEQIVGVFRRRTAGFDAVTRRKRLQGRSKIWRAAIGTSWPSKP